MMNRRVAHYAIGARTIITRLLDRMLNRVPTHAHAADAADASHGFIRVGLWVTLLLFGVGGLWSCIAPLDSAAVAVGQVVLNSSRKAIQHLEGGMVEEILVHEGDQVVAGQPLIRMRETASKAKLESLKAQRFSVSATAARLIAERDGKKVIDFSADIFQDAEGDPAKREVLANQKQIFASHQDTLQSQTGILNKKIKEYEHEMGGLSVQEKSQANQIGMLSEEIDLNAKLLEKGYTTKPHLLALQRQAEDLRGMRGKNIAAIAQAKQSVAESQLQIINFQQQRMADTVKELKDAQLQLADLEEQIRTSSDILERIVITSPLDGYVTSLNVHTTGGVISPGEKLMEIVPTGDKLIIEAQVSPQDIDVVRPGLPAHVRLTAYKTRHVPLLNGTVITVSADRITDSRTNTSFYLARIEADAQQLSDAKSIELYPGMPADVLIVTGSRTLLTYLLDPLNDTMHKAFKED